MPVPAKRTETLRKLFDRIKIADINRLFQVLNTNSNMTVIRNSLIEENILGVASSRAPRVSPLHF